jgi:hypothetical protein
MMPQQNPSNKSLFGIAAFVRVSPLASFTAVVRGFCAMFQQFSPRGKWQHLNNKMQDCCQTVLLDGITL